MQSAAQRWFIVIFALSAMLVAQAGQLTAAPRQILGTWRLVSYFRESPSGVRSNVMGNHPTGYINYGSDGRMIVILADSDRKKPAAPLATPSEAQALLQSMLAYAGTYFINEQAKTITHQIDVSWDQSRTGLQFVRKYEFEKDRLTLKTEPENDPATGEKTVRTLVFEKVK